MQELRAEVPGFLSDATGVAVDTAAATTISWRESGLTARIWTMHSLGGKIAPVANDWQPLRSEARRAVWSSGEEIMADQWRRVGEIRGTVYEKRPDNSKGVGWLIIALLAFGVVIVAGYVAILAIGTVVAALVAIVPILAVVTLVLVVAVALFRSLSNVSAVLPAVGLRLLFAVGSFVLILMLGSFEARNQWLYRAVGTEMVHETTDATGTPTVHFGDVASLVFIIPVLIGGWALVPILDRVAGKR